jgi:kynureninase
MNFENSLAFAQKLDSSDSLQSFREKYFIPQVNGKEALYFTGNSLGLQPKSVLSASTNGVGRLEKFGCRRAFSWQKPLVSLPQVFDQWRCFSSWGQTHRSGGNESTDL